MSKSGSTEALSVPRWVMVCVGAAHLLLPVGWVLAVRIGRPRFFGLFLYGALALVLFDIFTLKVVQTRPRDQLDRFRTVTDGRMVLVFLALTTVAFVSLGRGLFAYGLAAATGTLVIYRGFAFGRSRVGSTLLLTGLLGATLLAAKVFTVPYLAQTPDTFVHTHVTATIIEQSELSALRQVRYNGFLMFHVLTAIGSLIFESAPRQTAALLFIVAFPAAAGGVFALVRQLGQQTLVATVATLLFVTNVAFLEWGTKAHYQSLSAVILVFLLYVLLREVGIKRSIILLVPVSITWVSIHHLSVAMAVVLLVIPLLVRGIHNDRPAIESAVVPVFLFVAVVAKWVILTNWFISPISWILWQSPLAELGSTDVYIGTTGYHVSVYDDVGALFGATAPILADFLYLAPLLTLTGIGVLVMLRRRSRTDWLLLATAALPAVFYFPNPAWIPLWGVGVLTRWDIVALPFLVGVPALGVVALLRRSSSSVRRIGSVADGTPLVLFVFGTLLLTVTTGFYAPTTSDIIDADRYDKQYLDNQDLATADWVTDYAVREEPTYATSKLAKYLEHTTGPVGENTLAARFARISGEGGVFVFTHGLTVIQVRSFHEGAVKVKFTPNTAYYPNSTFVKEPVNSEKVSYHRYARNVVYDNGAVVIHDWDDRHALQG